MSARIHGEVISNPTPTIVSGYLPYATESSMQISLTIFEPTNLIVPQRIMNLRTVNSHFKFKFDLTVISSILLKIDGAELNGSTDIGMTGNTMLIEPADSLFIVLPFYGCRISDLDVSGRGSEKFSVLHDINAKLIDLYRTPEYMSIGKQISKTTIERRLLFIEESHKTIKDYLLANGQDLSHEAQEAIKVSLLSPAHYTAVLYFAKLDLTDPQVQKICRELYLDRLSVDNLVTSDMYGGLIHIYPLVDRALLAYAIRNNLKTYTMFKPEPVKVYAILSDYYRDHPLRSKIQAAYVVSQLKRYGVTGQTNEILNNYLDSSDQADRYHVQVASFAASLERNLTENAPAFNFALPDTAGNIVTLEQFRGKVVVVDFMFTGCAGCFFLAQAMESLEQEFKDKNVVFISISIDVTAARVKKGIGEFATKNSIHLYTAGQGYSHPIIEHYGINRYPTLVIIDREGRVASSRAPSPTTESGRSALKKIITDALAL